MVNPQTTETVRAVLEGGPAHGRVMFCERPWPALHVESDDGHYLWVYDLAATSPVEGTAVYTVRHPRRAGR